jgi:hypothetical protein
MLWFHQKKRTKEKKYEVRWYLVHIAENCARERRLENSSRREKRATAQIFIYRSRVSFFSY